MTARPKREPEIPQVADLYRLLRIHDLQGMIRGTSIRSASYEDRGVINWAEVHERWMADTQLWRDEINRLLAEIDLGQ